MSRKWRGLMNQRDVIEMDIIAVEVGNSNHGDFLKHVFAAWYGADNHNKVLMEPLVLALISKYKLKEEYAQAIKKHYPEYKERFDAGFDGCPSGVA